MSIESKIKKLLERAAPGPRYQEAGIKQGSSEIDQKGQADTEVLGSAKSGVAAAGAAGTTSLPTGQKPGSGEGVVLQGSSKEPQAGQEDEEDLAAGGENSPGKAASAKAGPAAPLPGSNAGGETAPVMQGSSGLPTPGQGGTPPLAVGQMEAANAAFVKAMTDAGIPEAAVAAIREAFELAVMARVDMEVEAASDTLAEAVQEIADAQSQELYESVNAYLNYAVEQWMTANELAVETGLRTDIAESFIDGLRTLFTEHAIEVPEENYDALKGATDRVTELEAKLNESMASVVSLTESVRTLERRQIVERATKDMVATDAEKFAKLVEDVEFETPESFAEKVDAMKVRYTAPTANDKPSTSALTEAAIDVPVADEVIVSVVKALSKSAKR